MLEYLVLIALLVPAAGLDLARHTIPNWLTYPFIVVGLTLGSVSHGGSGLANHFLGMLCAAGPLYLLFISGSLGGGDVKLMAAAGAIVGFPAAINALMASILVGGFCALFILIWQGRLLGMAWRFIAVVGYRIGLMAAEPAEPEPHKDAFPFGLAIAIGTLMVLIPPEWIAG